MCPLYVCCRICAHTYLEVSKKVKPGFFGICRSEGIPWRERMRHGGGGAQAEFFFELVSPEGVLHLVPMASSCSRSRFGGRRSRRAIILRQRSENLGFTFSEPHPPR